MTHAKLFRTSLAALGLAGLACVTINVYFPEQEIQDLSREIETEVREGARPAPTEEQEPRAPAPEPDAPDGPSGSTLGWLLGASPALAQGVPEPEITNPAIRAIIESRKARVAAIARYKASGVLGEGNEALLVIRGLDAVTDLRERADVQRLVREENADRQQLFKEIAAAKNVDASQLPRVQETYAGTLRDFARPGEWIQLPDGEWRKK